MEQSRIVVLLGMDGSGKTTILEKLSKKGYGTSNWQYLKNIKNFDHNLDLTIKNYINSLPIGNYVNHLPSLSRSAFVLSLLFAEYEFIIKPLLKSKKLVIVESYYVRVLAKEIVRDKSAKRVLNLAYMLPPPSKIILFNVSPGNAFKRKKVVSEHEVLCEKTFKDYCDYQQKVLKEALRIVDSKNVIEVDANQSIESVYDNTVSILKSLS